VIFLRELFWCAVLPPYIYFSLKVVTLQGVFCTFVFMCIEPVVARMIGAWLGGLAWGLERFGL
jgi:hypothetical protein